MTFLPTYLVLSGYPLLTATFLVSAMLLAGVVGQLTRGISLRYGWAVNLLSLQRRCAPSAFAAILLTQGAIQIAAMLCFGFMLQASFSVTIAMAHELMPTPDRFVSRPFHGYRDGSWRCRGLGFECDCRSYRACCHPCLLPVLVLAAALLFAVVQCLRKVLSNQ